MNNTCKRLLSLVMAVVMVMSYGIVPVAADDTVTCSHENAAETGSTAATCTVDGAKTFKCGSCEYEWTVVVPASGHSYTEEVTTAATCTDDGVKTFTCGNCGDSYTETISAAGHSYSENVTTAATCTTDGEKTVTCGTCGDTYTETVAATGHSYSEAVTTAATCTADGVKTFTCGNCGDSYTEAIPAGHTYVDGACSACGAEEPHTHSYGEGAVTREATCTAEGELTFTCECGDTYTEAIEMLAHDYKDGKCACGELDYDYDWCGTLGCDVENNVHHAECPFGPCTLTPGCQLVKGHEQWGAPCDVAALMMDTVITSNQFDIGENEVYIVSEIKNLNATQSVVVKLFSGEKLLATTTLKKAEYFNATTLGVKIIIKGTSSSWETVWEKKMPRADFAPDKLVLYIDGVEKSVAEVRMVKTNGEAAIEWADVPGVNPVPVATITRDGEEMDFGTLAEALNAAENGETVELVWKEGDKPIAMAGKVVGDKTVTITGTATVNWGGSTLYVGREGAGNGKLIFKDAKLTSNSTDHDHGIHVSGAKADANTNNGVLEIIDSEIELEYLINRNEINVSGTSKLTVNHGFYNHGRNADESADGNAKTAVFNIGSGSSVTIINEGNMGIGGESYGVLNINGGSFTAQNYLNVRANGTVNITSGTLTAETINNNGVTNVNGGNLNVTGILTNTKNAGIVNVSGESVLNIATLAGDSIDLQEGAIIKNSTVGGTVYVAGNVTFRGSNTFNMITDYGDYYNANTPSKWKVEQGGTLTLTSTERYGLGYGDQVTIESGATVTLDGGLVGMTNSAAPNAVSKFTAQSATLNFGILGDKSFGNKSGDYYGSYEFDFSGSTVNANAFKFYEDKGKTTLVSTNTNWTMNGHFMTNDADSKFTFTNSQIVSRTTVPGNDDANKNAGELILDNTPVTYNAIFTNTGTVVLKNGTKLTAPVVVNTADGAKIQIDGSAGYKDGDVVIDVTTAVTEDSFKNIEVINNGALKVKLKDGDVVIESAVAQVGDEYFDDLQDAIDAADGKTVVLLKDVSGTGFTVAADQDVTLDLNGNDLTMNPSFGQYGMTVSGNLTITGEGNVVIAPEMFVGFGIGVKEGATLTIDGGNYSAEGVSGIIASVSGTLEVNGGSFATPASNTSIFNTGNKAIVTITDGTFSHNPFEVRENDTRTIAISGGTFGTEVAEEHCAEGYIPVMKDGVYTVKAGAFHAKIVREVENTDPVKTIDVKFELLAEAIEAALANETVILLKDCDEDVTIDKVIELDMAGKAATGTITLGVADAKVKGDAGMTNIVTTVADHQVVYKDGYYYAAIPVAKVEQTYYDDLTEAINAADGKTVTLLKDATVENQIVIAAGETVTIDLNEKTLTTHGIKNAGTLLIKDGTVIGNNASYSTIESTGDLTVTNVTASGLKHVLRPRSGSATINSGTFTVKGTSGTLHALNVGDNEDRTSATVTVYGGTFVGANNAEANCDSGSAIMVQHESKVTVNGGTFTNGKGQLLMEHKKDTLILTGGTYDQNPTEFCADGYTAKKDGNVWTVTKAGASVTANGETTYYYSLADAAAAAKNMTGHVTISKLNNNPGTDDNTYPVNFAGPVTITGLGKNKDLALNLDAQDAVSVSKSGVVTVAARADDDSDYGSFIFAKLTTDRNGRPMAVEQIIFVEEDTKFIVNNDSTFELDKDVDFDGEYMLDDGDGEIDADDVTATFVDKNDNPLYIPEIKQGEKVTLVARSTAFFDTCTKIYVDSERVYTRETGSVNKNNFLVSEGCTELELTAQYVKNLPAGKHSVKFYHVIDGKEYETAKIYFKIIADDSKADPTNPKTGDFILMPMAIMTLSAAALAVLLIGKKKHA